MKKIIIIAMICINIIAIQHTIHAQEEEDIGIGQVIFADKEAIIQEDSFLINELGYNIIKIHLSIAEKNIETINYEWETLTTIKKLEELTKTDIITLLAISANKQEALSKYLNDCYQNLQKGENISAYMRQEMEVLKWDMQACLNDKNISDKAYFNAIDMYNQNDMEISLTDSIQYETCATENRIKYNARASIVQKLVFYLGLLQKKYDVLFAKQDILSKNFDIFRDNILPDLNQIDQLLEQYTF
jgi:hypothetical protein